ncbi:glycosyltransferase family 2 protein [Microbacterium sp. TWP3-1-2b2]|uniref:glycosyltransferase family 2 protein n=1 Tax=Microbacterium sp. TWP3-1-2b2 TaxID=2804651 RepID=UPI003CF07A27
MTNNKPTITVGLPVARESDTYVRQAVQSVVNQTYSDWELLIVADGSTPQLVRLLHTFTDPRIRVVAHKDSAGLAARLNEIASLARGEFLARFDADDIMMPNRLTHQLEFLRRSGADVIDGRAIVIDEKAGIVAATPTVTERIRVEKMFAATPLIHPAVFARTEWFRKHPYDESLLRCQDKALWITASEDSIIARDSERVLFYRVSSDLDPKKYARSARFERIIIRRYGPARIGKWATASTTARSWIKQQLIVVASSLGRGDAVMTRRYAALSRDDVHVWDDVLLRSLRTPVPSAQPRSEEKP